MSGKALNCAAKVNEAGIRGRGWGGGGGCWYVPPATCQIIQLVKLGEVRPR